MKRPVLFPLPDREFDDVVFATEGGYQIPQTQGTPAAATQWAPAGQQQQSPGQLYSSSEGQPPVSTQHETAPQSAAL